MTTARSSGAGDAPRRRSARSSRPPRSRTTGASSSTSSNSAASSGAAVPYGSPRDLISAGRAGRPHGLDGSFYVTRPVPELLATGATVLVAGERRRIERRAGSSARPIVRFEGSASRADAEALRGTDLLVPAGEAPPLGEDEFWAHELVGCTVVDGAREVGMVSRMVALPSCEALEVDGQLIPLVRDAIRSIDVAARRIDVDMEFVGE